MLVWIAGGGVVLWLLIGLVRMSGGSRPGFMPGLLGGMFGVVAGYWVYDTLFHPRRPSAHAEPAHPVQ